jgi:WD40 repeat protein
MTIPRCFAALVLLTLTACGAGGQPTSAPRTTPTPTPLPFDEAALEITTSTVPLVRELGVLQNTSPLSTVFAVSASPDGTQLAGLTADVVATWDLLTGQIIFSTGRQDAAYVFYSSDKTEIYTMTPGATVRIYDERGIEQNNFMASDVFERTLTFYPDLDLLAVGGVDGSVRVWELYTRTALATLDAQELRLSALAFSPDGERLATAGDEGVVRIWDWRTRTMLTEIRLEGGLPYQLAFSPDGAQIAVGLSSETRLFSTEDGALQHSLAAEAGGSGVTLAYAPDGRYVLVGGTQLPMTLWNTADGTLAARLPDTSGTVVSAAFSADGGLLLTSLLGAGARLWNLETINPTEQLIQSVTLDTPTTEIRSVAWTPDNRLILLMDAQGPIYAWGIGPEAADLPTLTPAP